MKKIFLLFTAAALSAGMVFAQDINQATENYNNGAMELQMGNNEAAITYFQTALEMAEALGEEGAEVAANCRSIIPAIYLSSAKEQIKADNFDAAVEQLGKAIEAAGKYEVPEVADDANALMPQVYLSKGNGFLQAKNFPEAEAAYKQAIELDATNGMAYFRLGQALASQNKVADAEAAYVQAAANGQEKNANKQLSNMFVKLAQAANKAKKYQEVLDYSAKSNQYLENANAYRFAASASQQLGKNADCIANYEKYLELSPNAKDAAGVKFTIAALYQQSGDKAKAKEYYQMVSTDPQYGPSAQEQLKTL
ncbi:MAG: tetratricopeptide repeat protein [Bacteroidales bacterium]|nr:tetratricopeptide repeat protein [Bacteroidales bacterium]